MRMSSLRSSVAVCCSLLLVLQILLFGVTFCTYLLVAFQEDGEIMTEPFACSIFPTGLLQLEANLAIPKTLFGHRHDQTEV